MCQLVLVYLSSRERKHGDGRLCFRGLEINSDNTEEGNDCQQASALVAVDEGMVAHETEGVRRGERRKVLIAVSILV